MWTFPQHQCSRLLVMVLVAWAFGGGTSLNVAAQENPSSSDEVSLVVQGEHFLCYPINPDGTAAAADDRQVARSVAAGGDYVWPPRCGSRNCWAMCVTCLYDLCRHYGGTLEDCRAEREHCKWEDCPTLEPCPPSNPYCDFNR